MYAINILFQLRQQVKAVIGEDEFQETCSLGVTKKAMTNGGKGLFFDDAEFVLFKRCHTDESQAVVWCPRIGTTVQVAMSNIRKIHT